ASPRAMVDTRAEIAAALSDDASAQLRRQLGDRLIAMLNSPIRRGASRACAWSGTRGELAARCGWFRAGKLSAPCGRRAGTSERLLSLAVGCASSVVNGLAG